MVNKFPTSNAIIFDVDGTLLQTESVIDAAYFGTFQDMKEKRIYTKEIPPIEKMYSCLGMLLEDIWAKILPGESKEVQDYASEQMLKLELEELKKGNGVLYPGVIETLKELQQIGFRIFIASNGLEDYVKGVVKYCGLEPFIEKAYSAGEYQTASKSDLVRILIEKHNLNVSWMVGDRSSDVEAGKNNGLMVVGCDYSDFKDTGELDGADIIISDFKDILRYI